MAYENTCTNVWPFWYFIPATNSQRGLSLRSLLSRVPPVLIWEAQTPLSMQRNLLLLWQKPISCRFQPYARLKHNIRLKFVLLCSTPCMCTPIFFPGHIWRSGQSVLAGLLSHRPPSHPSSTGSFFFAPLISSRWPYSRSCRYRCSVDAGSPWPSLEGIHCNIYYVGTWFSFPLRFLFLWLCIVTNFCIFYNKQNWN